MPCSQVLQSRLHGSTPASDHLLLTVGVHEGGSLHTAGVVAEQGVLNPKSSHVRHFMHGVMPDNELYSPLGQFVAAGAALHTKSEFRVHAVLTPCGAQADFEVQLPHGAVPVPASENVEPTTQAFFWHTVSFSTVHVLKTSSVPASQTLQLPHGAVPAVPAVPAVENVEPATQALH